MQCIYAKHRGAKMENENTDEDGWIELFAHPLQNESTKTLLQGQEL